MTDRLEKLEAELKRLRPAAMNGELVDRIGAEIGAPPARTWGDHLLICAMSSGAIAACVIAAIVLRDAPGAAGAAPNVIAAVSSSPAPRAGDVTVLLAQADTALWSRSVLNR